MKPRIKLTFLLFFLFANAFGIEIPDAELLYQQDEITVMPNKLLKKSVYRIKINNRAGERYAIINIPHSEICQVSNIEGHIENAFGQTVRKLSRSDIEVHSAYSDGAFYSDEMVSEFTLKYNSYPYIIEYSYETKETDFLYVEQWMPILDWGIPTRDANLIIHTPLEFQLRYSAHLISAPDSVVNGKDKTYRWKASLIVKDKREVLSPSFHNIVPVVNVVPDQFDFDEKGSFRTWQTYGDWQLKLLEGLNNLPEEERTSLKKLVEGIDDEKEKIRKLYHQMQDVTRYINVSIETGGMRPHPAAYVAQNKYGDCKALANYFKSVLEVVEIDSYYTKVYAGSPKRAIDTDFPSQQFNHAILLVPLKNDTLWLDCTSDGPFNYLGSFSQDRNAFVIQKGNHHFVRTPAMLPSDVVESRKIAVSYNEGQASKVILEGKYKGRMFELIDDLERYNNEKDRFRFVADYFLGNGFELDSYSIKEQDRDSTWVEVVMNTTHTNLFKNYGTEMLVCNIPYPLPEFEKPGERHYPVQLDKPVFLQDIVTYELPAGTNVSSIREDKQINTLFGDYEIHCVVNGNVLTVSKKYLLNSGSYQLKSYPDFFDFIQQVKTEENKPLLIIRK